MGGIGIFKRAKRFPSNKEFEISISIPVPNLEEARYGISDMTGIYIPLNIKNFYILSPCFSKYDNLYHYILESAKQAIDAAFTYGFTCNGKRIKKKRVYNKQHYRLNKAERCKPLIAEKNMNNWIETSGSPFVIVEQQYAHQWKGQENYNAICSVTDYLGKIYIDNHVLLVMGDEPMATRIVNKDGAILIIRWKYAPDYLTVEKLLENDIVNGIEPIEEVEVKWDSTELVLFDSLSPYCEASVKVFLSLQKTSCIIKTYLYQKDEVSLIIHSIQ